MCSKSTEYCLFLYSPGELIKTLMRKVLTLCEKSGGKSMRTRYCLIIMAVIFAVISLSGCGLMALQAPLVTEDVSSLHTAVAQTITVRLTQEAFETLAAQVTQLVATASATPYEATTESTPTMTAIPPTVEVPQPTATLLPPTATAVPPTATPTIVPCNLARFEADVSVPDYTPISPGASFTKIWRLRNTGSCTWTTNYAVVFVDGYAMTDKPVVKLPVSVRPGEWVDITVNLVAPTNSGNYKGNWMLRNESNSLFGVGTNGDKPFWVLIKVLSANMSYTYDFTYNSCNAEWQSGRGKLPCPGSSDDARGFVVILDNPVLENRSDDEPALWTNPDFSGGGWISGKYPPVTIKSGDRFKSWVGCLANSKGCHVVFRLDYRIGDGPAVNLGEWHEIYDGQASHIDLDLSYLAGQKVQFILNVVAIGEPENARAFWFSPAIKSAKPTENSDDDPNLAVKAAMQEVANDIGMSVDGLSLASVEKLDWRDTCLGIGSQSQNCAPAIIPGYRIMLATHARHFEVHTNLDGSETRWFEIFS
jgi:hypothetical protein